MSISYEPLWNELRKRNMKKKDLINLANLTTNVLANMGKEKGISMKNIEKICTALELSPNDIFIFKNSRKKENDNE